MLESHELDEDVSYDLVGNLRDVGYVMNSVKDSGNFGLTDARRLLWAVEHGRTMITHNRKDFRLLHEALSLWASRWGAADVLHHHGILVLPHLPVPERVRLIDEFARERDNIDNRLFVFDRQHGWQEYH
jgi:Domain of unknown function (DUF5615)